MQWGASYHEVMSFLRSDLVSDFDLIQFVALERKHLSRYQLLVIGNISFCLTCGVLYLYLNIGKVKKITTRVEGIPYFQYFKLIGLDFEAEEQGFNSSAVIGGVGWWSLPIFFTGFFLDQTLINGIF